MDKKKILFVGDLNKHTRSYQRFKALKSLGHDVTALSFVKVPWEGGKDKSSVLDKVFSKLGFPRDKVGINGEIKRVVRSSDFDIVWLEKGNTYKPSTLRFIKKNRPGSVLVSCAEDNMALRHNRSRYFLKGLPQYDILFTTKKNFVEKLGKMGAKRVEAFLDAYDKDFCRPVKLSEEEKEKYGCKAGFIGTFEDDRAENILFLAQNGIPVTVWGSGWNDWKNRHPNLIVRNEPLYGEGYMKAINATKINLCFLRKINFDEVTSRSVEIPACGGFMLAERTKRHEGLFEDGKEAVFFDSKEDLLVKARKYLEDDDMRKKIAEAGRERCVRSPYSQEEQLSEMLGKISDE